MVLEDLNAHKTRLGDSALKDIASARAGKAVLSAAGWAVDLSRHFLDEAAEDALLAVAHETGLEAAIRDLFSGAIVNPSEDRPALHWGLRAAAGNPIADDVRMTVAAALDLASDVRNGHFKPARGERFRAIVHLGIGGSDFGPRLLADAFGDSASDDLDLRFCANLDPLDLDLALKGLDPKTTLVIGISKSFGTEETLYNLGRCRAWLKRDLGEDWARNVVLVTANAARADAWLEGASATVLDLPESIGGRFSIWSAGSFACMCALGPEKFSEFLGGAREMDVHVKNAALETNLAVRLALLDVWNTSVMGFSARACLAYSRRLRLLPTYLQQLEMESNGKSVSPDGVSLSCETAPLLWGGEGTIGQHSYHQWLHQGTHVTPTEFIIAPGTHSDPDGVVALKAHALAQAEVLANGRSLEDILADEPDLPRKTAAQKVHPGGRPSTVLFAPELSTHALGALIALYEHRTYLAGCLWNLNSFDQWGVERGKTMAGQLKAALRGEHAANDTVSAELVRLVGDD